GLRRFGLWLVWHAGFSWPARQAGPDPLPAWWAAGGVFWVGDGACAGWAGGSGNGRGRVPAGYPFPVEEQRRGGGGQRGTNRDQGDLPAGHAARGGGVDVRRGHGVQPVRARRRAGQEPGQRARWRCRGGEGGGRTGGQGRGGAGKEPGQDANGTVDAV